MRFVEYLSKCKNKKLKNRMSSVNKTTQVYINTFYGDHIEKSWPFLFIVRLTCCSHSALRCIYRPILVPLPPLINLYGILHVCMPHFKGSLQCYRHHCILHACQQFGALYMHYFYDKHLT